MAITRHVFETYIRSTPEQVWQGLTDPAFTKQYFYGCSVDSGWQPGGGYRFTGEFGPAIEGVVEEIDPPRRLVMTWRLLFDEAAAAEPPSRVEWEITPVGDVVRVTCIHGDLASSPVTWAITADGWSIVLNGLKTLLETGSPLGDVPSDGQSPFAPTARDAAGVDGAWHRNEGIAGNNGVYALLDQANRTPDDDARMVHMAHATVHHWAQATGSGPANLARGEYLCSHVYAYLARAEPARYHAARCLTLCDDNGLDDFDRAFAHEAMARALAVAGDLDGARRHVEAARAVPIANDEDRAICEADLLAGPWYGLDPSPAVQ